MTAASAVGGSIQIVQSGAATIDRVAVNGDVLFDDNDKALVATFNTIGGNLKAFRNTGGVRIANDTIEGNLQRRENVPPPVGGNNIVEGSKEDQCANLQEPPLQELPFKAYLPGLINE